MKPAVKSAFYGRTWRLLEPQLMSEKLSSTRGTLLSEDSPVSFVYSLEFSQRNHNLTTQKNLGGKTSSYFPWRFTLRSGSGLVLQFCRVGNERTDWDGLGMWWTSRKNAVLTVSKMLEKWGWTGLMASPAFALSFFSVRRRGGSCLEVVLFAPV